MASHPLDYFWLWTPEDWTWGGNKPEEYNNTVRDIRLALEALHNVKAPFQLATCGWVLGPGHDRAAFDHDLPKAVPMAAISRNTGVTEVDPAFGQIGAREKWAIPWLESDKDNGLAAIQLEAGRMRRDATDALAYGCTGLMGLHWRTEILSPNISALAQAAWDQSWNTSTNKKKPRALPCDDFYADWARANFGLEEAGKVFATMDGKVPQVTNGDCPSGMLTPVKKPWSEVAPQFAFVDDLAKLRPGIHGPGNLDRFDYWLNTFKYHRSLAQLRCALAQPDPAELTRLYSDTYRYLLASVNTPGALATVVNMENHPGWGALVARDVREPWPRIYQGKPRLIVPTVRSQVVAGEVLVLKAIALDNQPMKSFSLYRRPLGSGGFEKIDLEHLSRGVYTVTLAPAAEDFEYYLKAETAAGAELVWPATAPQINQTVVVMAAGM